MSSVKDWDHKSEWRRRGDNFMVMVTRHYVEPSVTDWDMGKNRWAVYAYIYPKHHSFGSFDIDGGLYQSATSNMPLHSGPSYFMVHRAGHKGESEISAFQVGSDYNHLHDAHYSHHGDDDPPHDVFEDADRLFKYLNEVEA